MGTNLLNHSYVDLTLVGDAPDSSDSVQCHTDLSTCCTGVQDPDRGDWYSPSGAILPLVGGGDVYFKHEAQRVDMRYTGSGGTSGIYRCDIETNAVNDEDGRETVYVGLYASGGKRR